MFFGGVNHYAALFAYQRGPVGPFKILFVIRLSILPAAYQPGGAAHILPEAPADQAAPEVEALRRLDRTNNVVFHAATGHPPVCGFF